jgi:hypothetical protein
LTLQEYFVAQYISNQNELPALLAHCGDPWWEEVLLLYAGQTGDASALFRALLEKEEHGTMREDLFSTNLLLAGRCLAAHPTIRQRGLREEVSTGLLELLTTASHRLMRRLAAEIIAEANRVLVPAMISSTLALIHENT